MESETDDNCYERKDIPVDRVGGDFYHSRDVTTRQLNRHMVHACMPDLSPAGGLRPISLPAKLSGTTADGGVENDTANGLDGGSLIRRYAEVTKFKPESPQSGSARSSIAVAKRRLSALHASVQQQHQQHEAEILDDDDLAPLLPSNRELSQEELYESHTSLVSSSDGGILAEGEDTSSDESEPTDTSASASACVLSLVERLLRTHPVWFLPGIQRSGAIHLLQGKEEGNFIVRGSSQSKTMAVSVRLPANVGPYIEHYLIQSNNSLLSLESSRFKFDSIPALIAHYTQCCDELPVQLCLPAALREAKNRQQLSSLALLGQEFWRYPMASCSPKPKLGPPIVPPLSATSSHMNTPSEATHSSGIGVSVLNHTPTTVGGSFGNSAVGAMAPGVGVASVGTAFGETPTDTFSTMSGFTVSNNGHTLLSPESIDSAIMMSPMDPTHHHHHQHQQQQQQQQTGIVGKTSTFKARKQILSPATPHEVEKQIELFNANILGQHGAELGNGDDQHGTAIFTSTLEVKNLSTLERKPRAPRPTPPNTLNIKPIRSPPAPPARRMKVPLPESSPTVEGADMFTPKNGTFASPASFTTSFPRKDVTPVTSNNPIVMTPTVATTIWYTDGENLGEQVAPVATQPQTADQFGGMPIDSPCITIPASTRVSRRNKRKESKHYQESDILESPSVYCRSALGDKISDYEDIWSQDAMKSDRRSLLATRHGMFASEGFNDSALKGLVSPSIESMHRKPASHKPVTHGISTFSVDNLAFGQAPDSASDRGSTPTEKPRPTMILKTFSPVPKEDITTPQGVGHHHPSFEVGRQRSCLNISHTAANVGTPLASDEPVHQGVVMGGQVNHHHHQNSPFYADPADIMGGIVRRSPLNRLASSNSSQRHSEPPKQLLLLGHEDLLATSCSSAPHPWGNGNGYHVNNNFAASLDELALEKNEPMLVGVRLNELSIRSNSGGAPPPTNDYDSDIRWKAPAAVDRSTVKSGDRTEQSGKQMQRSNDSLITRPITTIHQIIAKKLPQLNLSERLLDGMLLNVELTETGSGTLGNRSQRKSAYDNVEKQVNAYASSAINSSHSDDGTVFSEPWDSSQWDSFLPNEQVSTNMAPPGVDKSVNASCDSGGLSAKDNRYRKDAQQQPQQKVATILRSRSCRDREILCHPRNRNSLSGPGESIATYAFYLAGKLDSTFSRNISNFIACTKESKAAPHPQVVMRNMRQFMSGMKNYLVKHGEGEFAAEVQKARAQLKADEFLNLDSILEEVMHKLVILPLREHLYGLFVDYYSNSGDIQLIVEKVRSTAGRSPAAFGVKGNVIPPSANAMRQIATLFVRLQEAELPLVKLDLLLAAVSAIFEATTCCNGQQMSADDFLPLLVMVVAHCGFVGAEIEAEYMWGLLQPSLLSGEAGYYLTALCSAVHVLKNFKLNDQEGTATLDWESSTMPNCSSVLRVIIPDEYNGSIQTRTLPIRPHTTTKEVCRIIAHKARITNAQDYGLFKLIDGEETLLHDTECPQDVRMTAKGKHFMIAYKRIDAKIAWPTVKPHAAATATGPVAVGNNAPNVTSNTTITTTATTNNAIATTTITASDNQLKV